MSRQVFTPPADTSFSDGFARCAPTAARGAGGRTNLPRDNGATPTSPATMMSRVSTTRSAQDAVDPTAAGSTGAALASGVLEAQALERLRELDPTGQNKLLERVFRAFEQSIGRLMPQLDAARAGADWQAVRHVAHTLKSSSASIGAIKLSQLCADIETMVRQSQVEDLPARLDAMGDEVARVLAALHALQGGAT